MSGLDASVSGTVPVCTGPVGEENRLSATLVEVSMQGLPPIELNVGEVNLASSGPTTLWLTEGYSPDGDDIGNGVWVQGGQWLVNGEAEELLLIIDLDEPTGEVFNLDEPRIEPGVHLSGRLYVAGSGRLDAEIEQASATEP